MDNKQSAEIGMASTVGLAAMGGPPWLLPNLPYWSRAAMFYLGLLLFSASIIALLRPDWFLPKKRDEKVSLEDAARFAKAELGRLSFYGIGEGHCQGDQDRIMKFYASRLVQARIPFYSNKNTLIEATALDLTVDAGKLSVGGATNLWIKKTELSAALEQMKEAHPNPPPGAGIYSDVGRLAYIAGNRTEGPIGTRNIDISIIKDNVVGKIDRGK